MMKTYVRLSMWIARESTNACDLLLKVYTLIIMAAAWLSAVITYIASGHWLFVRIAGLFSDVPIDTASIPSGLPLAVYVACWLFIGIPAAIFIMKPFSNRYNKEWDRQWEQRHASK